MRRFLNWMRGHIYVLIGVFSMMFVFAFLVQKNIQFEASAANLANFDAGNIISDYQMSDYNSMTEAEIQNFLSSKNNCGNRNYSYYQSLSNSHPSITWHWADGHFVCLSEERFGDGEVIGSGDTAAHIIWQAAQDYRINPKVLIVLLQKETGLITDPIPNNNDYRKAAGYGCPDTAACSSKYYGFKNQVRNAAALFRTVLDGGWTNYPVGSNYVQYSPDSSCGGSWINIQNRATSALYRYTPYQPNSAALNAGYGAGDSCSSYGNRNFYSYFEDWFGGTTNDGKVLYDLPDDELSKTAISWLFNNNITKYYTTAGYYAPNALLTEAQLAIMLQRVHDANISDGDVNINNSSAQLTRADVMYYLWKFEGMPVESETKVFDLPQDELGRISMDWAYNNSIAKYYSVEGSIEPYLNITRREVAIFLWRYAGEPEVDVTQAKRDLNDLPTDELGEKAMAWAYNNGIIKYYNVEGSVEPYLNITRREVAIFLWRYAGKPESSYNINVFNDLTNDSIKNTAINWAYVQGITKYYMREGEFAPLNITTRREIAIFLWRLYHDK